MVFAVGGRRDNDLRIDLPLAWRAVVTSLAASVLKFDGNLWKEEQVKFTYAMI